MGAFTRSTWSLTWSSTSGSGQQREGLKNLVAVQATPDSPSLPEKVDRILLVDTYHHIGDRIAYFKRLRESLRPGGQVAIIDFTAESPIGPPPGDRISARKVAEEMTLAGYAQVRCTDSFLTSTSWYSSRNRSSRENLRSLSKPEDADRGCRLACTGNTQSAVTARILSAAL